MASNKGYDTILVAIDRTPEADEVIASAIDVADQHSAQLTVLTVVNPVTYAYASYDPVSVAALPPEEEVRKSVLADLTEKVKAAGLSADQADVRLGRPASVIKDTAKEIAADLIVMGSHCRQGLGLLLGSTATGVLHGAPCDVLTLRIEE